MGEHILSWMTFFPVIGAAVIVFIPSERKEIIKTVAASAAAVPLILAVKLFIEFDRGSSAFQFVEHYTWIKAFNIEYFMGIDGLSVPMVLLTAFLSFLCIIASWNIDKSIKGYFALFLILEAGMIGVFCALDFFLFFVFWEVMLLPMYFLIGVWGGPRREYAAIKFFIYTFAGGVLMLLSMIALYLNVSDPVTGGHTFNMVHMMDQANHSDWLNLTNIRHIIWIALFIGFAIKVPIFPFHTWLPDAHVEAPTAVSVILAGVLLKMGTYGILRISYPILPDQAAWFSFTLAVLGCINILYGAYCAMAQSDILFFGVPHGLRAAGHVGDDLGGHQRRGAADVQPRHHHRHDVPLRGRGLRPGPHPRNQRLRRARHADAALLQRLQPGPVRCPGSAGTERLRQ